jgi:polyisoprenyl-teichoic acid--peptidoglycan teichoic acid transferase
MKGNFKPGKEKSQREHKLKRMMVLLGSGVLIAGLVGFLLSRPIIPITGDEAAGQANLSTSTPTAALVTPQAGAGKNLTTTPLPTQISTFPAGTPVPTATPVPLPTPNPWTGKERVNVLVLGVDYADWDSPDRAGPPRSDAMILLTIDPKTKTAGMLSIPRDLYVDIPGMIRPNRINAAHRFGELYDLPGGGPALAARTVENLLGVPVHYYARIDFSAFERFIDEIGGIEIDVPEEITVDPIGPNNKVTLKAGKQTLDGPTALAYARSRNTPGNDSDRSARQQQVIMAVQKRLLKLNTLPLMVYKAPGLYRELSEGIQTNLTLDEAIQLAWLAIQIDRKDIKSEVIGPNQVVIDKTDEGWSVYRPIPERIQWLVSQFFAVP